MNWIRIDRVLCLGAMIGLLFLSCRGQGEYELVIEGFDWGPAVTKAMLVGKIESPRAQDFEVQVVRESTCLELEDHLALGTLTVIRASRGKADQQQSDFASFTTLVFAVGPHLPVGSPMMYVNNDRCAGNHWLDYQLTIKHLPSGRTWNVERSRTIPTIDDFTLDQSFTDQGGTTLTFADYTPDEASTSRPLLIWLHGGGEGGVDTRLPLLANRATAYATEETQEIFDGAYVLVPQCRGAWMHNESGISTRGKEEDIYHKALFELIVDYVRHNPRIDPDRIYVGGCSNGGYMSLKLLLEHPNFFAAAFISSLAYHSEYLTDEQLNTIRHIPIWFVHSRDDNVTVAAETAIPIYKRLKALGSNSVHLSLYDHVVDLTGFFGGSDFHYGGHASWVYSHANDCRFDMDGSPVLLDGKPTRLMQWIAAQSK